MLLNVLNSKNEYSSFEVEDVTADFFQIPLFEVNHKTILKLSVDIIDIQGYWQPELYRPKMQLDWSFSFDSAVNRNFPFLTFFDHSGINQFTVAFDNHIDEIRFTVRMNQTEGTYDIVVEVANPTGLKSIGIYINKNRLPWMDILAEYGMKFRSSFEICDKAWQPVYCTWYARHRNLDYKWVESTAATAKRLGFGTIILDEAWSMDSVETLRPETVNNWYGPVGDWKVSSKKFSDFKNHVKKIKDMGLNYMLWAAPFLIGNQSEAYKKYSKFCRGQVRDDGLLMLDTGHTDIIFEIVDELANLVDNYGLDGLKIDFIDSIKNSVEHCGARELERFFTHISERFDGKMIEFRQRYANFETLKYATQFRANDVPFDFIENLHRLAHLRMILGNAAAVHADPAYWNYNDNDENVARHMISSLLGVPMISVDFNKAKPSSLDIVKNWLCFYNTHLSTLKHGKWNFSYNADYLRTAKCNGENETIIVVVSDCFKDDEIFADSKGDVYVINFSKKNLFLKCTKYFDCYCRPVNQEFIAPAGLGMIKGS